LDSTGHEIDVDAWESAVYAPTPTIIEAAQALFTGHRVRDISHAFSDTLDATSDVIVSAIQRSQQEKLRTICFVTGIPGSGKTLVGLNAVHSPLLLNDSQSSAVFLSGNGPLIKVIRESLSREQALRGIRKSEAKDIASSFIANVHGFIKRFGIDGRSDVPKQNAIVFDEAQRAWSGDAVVKAHKGAQHLDPADRSEPAMILDIMERVANWATIVALVGGGQEINSGEAGLSEWGKALSTRAKTWQILVSSEVLEGGDSVAGGRLFPGGLPPAIQLTNVPQLHLSVNVRSHRAKLIGSWVNKLLSGEKPAPLEAVPLDEFPIVMTRDLDTARKWLRQRQEHRQRIGLLASSGAIRLRAHGIEVSSGFRKSLSYADWFLNEPSDVRSSYKLEIAATEFDCRGLEIDWAGICWGGDYVVDPATGQWMHWKFSGTGWKRVGTPIKQIYLQNKYRVLLTRARRGMIIWIPNGSEAAKEQELLDATAKRLHDAGIPKAPQL
jgi:hypothetical protein